MSELLRETINQRKTHSGCKIGLSPTYNIKIIELEVNPICQFRWWCRGCGARFCPIQHLPLSLNIVFSPSLCEELVIKANGIKFVSSVWSLAGVMWDRFRELSSHKFLSRLCYTNRHWKLISHSGVWITVQVKFVGASTLRLNGKHKLWNSDKFRLKLSNFRGYEITTSIQAFVGYVVILIKAFRGYVVIIMSLKRELSWLILIKAFVGYVVI